MQDNAIAPLHIVNTILHDCNNGIIVDGDTGERSIGRNNLFNSNTANVSGYLTPNTASVGSEAGESQGDVTGSAPGFTDEAGNDYTLTSGSAAKAAGFDAKFVDDFWDSFIGATNPPTP